jgi:SulP family sulfate permease
VALPLALGFGVASGVGAQAGIVTAIVAGVVAAIFGGSSVQVSGPTGAMAVVLAPIVAKYGASAVPTVALMAGVIILAMGVLGLGRTIQFVPWPVLEGFTVGIAGTIVLQQFPLVLGRGKGSGSSVLDSAWLAVRSSAGSTTWTALALGAAVVAVMLVWPRITRKVPASIVAVVVVSIPAALLKLAVPTIGTLPRHLPAPSVPHLSGSLVSHLFGPALAVAVLAAIESLLSARVADAMTGQTETSDAREMFGQGLANVACGLFGGMPATGAIARTAVNVRSGARSRAAAITHSLVIVVVILAAAPIVTKIPLAVLGGVLVMTAVRMVNYARLRAVIRAHRLDAIIVALTAVVTISVNLVTAIEVGLVVAGILSLRAVAAVSGAIQESLDDHFEPGLNERELLPQHIAIYRLDGALFFAAVPRFLESFRALRDVRVVILRVRGLTMIDSSGNEALSQIVEDLERRGVVVLIKGLSHAHSQLLSTSTVLETVRERGHLFDTIEDALDHARHHVGSDVDREQFDPSI